MSVSNIGLVRSFLFVVVAIACAGCSFPIPWPTSPLYPEPTNDADWVPPATVEAAKQEIVGHYAHYDIVAYEGETPNGPLSTFVISYGFTDFVIEDGELIEEDRFCSAAYKANQNFETMFPDAATQAIVPRRAVVEVFQEDGAWKVYRPATPTLIGASGNPDEPLTQDPAEAVLSDDDNDGKPGVTVFVSLFGFIDGEIYIARREVFQNDMTLYSDGSLRGNVIDDSEQLVVGASLDILNVPNNPAQRRDPGLNPIILIPIDQEIDTCEELMALRDTLFPPEPEF